MEKNDTDALPINVNDIQQQLHKNSKGQNTPFTFTLDGLPSILVQKLSGLIKVLNSSIIDTQQMKRYLSEGIPDEAALVREYCWKIILGYLPEQKVKWEATIEKQEQTYRSLVNMFLPNEKFPQYPLLLKKDHPRFKQLQSDYLLWEQIEKDTSRTHAQFSFFATQTKEIMLPYLTSARREKFKLINGEDALFYKQFLASKEMQRKTYRYDYMTRILYIYSKLNPKIEYVQGMNQILAPIFYLVNVTKSAHSIQEASCFFMFNNAISDIIELHIKDLDKSKNGIHGKLNEVNQMLMVIEPNVWKRMEELKIDPFYYCFRWVTLLYAQDFPLFDTLRIWESIFSSDNRMQYINFFAIAIIISCKDVILQYHFTVVLEHLQQIKDHIHINEVIKITNQLIASHSNKDFYQLAEKGKKQIQKEWQKEKVKKQKEREKEQRLQKQEDQKNRKNVEKHKQNEDKRLQSLKQKEKKEKGREENCEEDKKKRSLTEQKKQIEDEGVSDEEPKKLGFLKRFSSMVDKFLK